MECKILKHDNSWNTPDKEGFEPMPLFGHGTKNTYKLMKIDGNYVLNKTWLDDEGIMTWSNAPIQDHEAHHMIKGHSLIVDGDYITIV